MIQDVFIRLLKNYEALSFPEIVEETGYSEDEVFTAITELSQMGLISKSRHGRYQVAYVVYEEGVVTKQDKDGIEVWIDSYGSIRIYTGKTKYSVGSKLLLGIMEDMNHHIQAKVMKRLSIEHCHHVGTVEKENDTLYAISKGKKYKLHFPLPVYLNKVVDFQISSAPNGELYAEIMQIVCDKDDPCVDDKKIVQNFGVSFTFPDDVLAEAKRLPQEVERAEYQNRRDLTQEDFVTIDHIDTKDMDDAITCTYHEETKRYHLKVAIADVSHYVKENSALDKEAYRRSTSIYLNDLTIPMLPKELSEGICSLNPLVDRLAWTWDIWLDHKGSILSWTLYPAVIRSKKKMDYDSVNRVLAGEEVEGYHSFYKQLVTMHKLALLIHKKQVEQGCINFDTKELSFSFDENHNLLLQVRNRGAAEFIIEKFMLLTNELTAKRNQKYETISLYRQHEAPNLQNLKNYLKKLKTMNYPVSVDIDALNRVDGHFLQTVLEELSKSKDGTLGHAILVRSMNLARYGIADIPHFGLGSIYTHVTSPIRRYCDLILHRQIDQIEKHEFTSKDWVDKLVKTALQITEQTKRASRMERESNQMKLIDYLNTHTDTTYTATVFDKKKDQIFIKIHPYLIEAVLQTNDDTSSYALGELIEVDYLSGDKETGKIYFKKHGREKTHQLRK